MKKTQLSDLIAIGLLHSIAQGFLIFSGALVIVSIWNNNTYISFYALFNFKIEAIRKHPSLGNYGMRDIFGVILYTTTSLSLLLLWIVGSVLLLNFEFSKKDYIFLISGLLLIIWLISFLWWIGLIFYRKTEKSNSAIDTELNKTFYEVVCICDNCDLHESVKIKNGIKVGDIICPKCGIAQQLKVVNYKTIKKCMTEVL